MEEIKKTILLVEDDAFIGDIIEKHIQNAGMRCMRFDNGRDALNALKSEPIDLILTDLDMPIMTGCEMLENYKSDSVSKDLPVIILTNQTNEDESVKRVAALGIKDFFAKSSTPMDMLIARIEVMLNPRNLNMDHFSNELDTLSEMTKIPNMQDDFKEIKRGLFAKLKDFFFSSE